MPGASSSGGAATSGTVPRRFCRFRDDAPADSTDYSRLPNDGFCLNVFLIVHDPDESGRVLLGHLDTAAPWARIGGLDTARAESSAPRWMLPASHLLVLEDPNAAAQRLAREMLGAGPLSLRGPAVFSETYWRADVSRGGDPHWDIHFLYDATWPESVPPTASAWRELAFVDVARTTRSEFARAHGDILALAGLSPKD